MKNGKERGGKGERETGSGGKDGEWMREGDVMSMSKEAELTKLAQEVTGRGSPEEALEVTLRSYLEQKIDDYRQDIQDLETKYRMSFEEFKERLGKELDLSWQHERDFMCWEEAITNLNHFHQLLDCLRTYV